MKKDKPLGRKAYGSIPHLPGSKSGTVDKVVNVGLARICTKKARDWRDLVIVQEKLDGSCVSAAYVDDQIVPLGRAGYRAESSPFRQHHMWAEWVYGNTHRLRRVLTVPGMRIVGEWMVQATGTRYDVPHEPFVAFDIFTPGNDRLPYHVFLNRVLPERFITPQLVHIGHPITVEHVMKRLATAKGSAHGALEDPEGAVWRVERNGKVDFLAKYVRHGKVDGKYLPDVEGSVTDTPIWNDWAHWIGKTVPRPSSS